MRCLHRGEGGFIERDDNDDDNDDDDDDNDDDDDADCRAHEAYRR